MQQLSKLFLSLVSGGNCASQSSNVYYINEIPYMNFRDAYNIPADVFAPAVMVPMIEVEPGKFVPQID